MDAGDVSVKNKKTDNIKSLMLFSPPGDA
jgi:hypothetical protein